MRRRQREKTLRDRQRKIKRARKEMMQIGRKEKSTHVLLVDMMTDLIVVIHMTMIWKMVVTMNQNMVQTK